MPSDATRALRRALEVLLPALDVVEGRVADGAPPAWCEARGWTDFLLSTDNQDVVRCEERGLAAAIGELRGAPPSLAALARDVAEASRVPALEAPPIAPAGASRSIGQRKQRQLEGLLGALAPMAARARRIVDVGAGQGHLARLSSVMFDRDALGLERDATRVERASALADAAPRARFAQVDVGRDALALAPGDLAVGLHACGALGDRLVGAAARAGADVALVSCCLQKIDGEARAALSREGARAGFSLRRDALGLTNLTTGPEGVEASLAATMDARRARHALTLLLRRRGVDVAPGEEMRGQNRRRAHRGLAAIAGAALVSRGLAPATEAELAACDADARAEFERMRRLSLPRAMLARLCEVAVVLDRAAALAEAGHEARVATVFDARVTPRNLGVFALAR